MVAIDVIARDRASATFRSIGNSANTMASRMTGVAAKLGLVTSGALAVAAGFKASLKLGLDFTTQMNTLQAVTGASAKVMAQVSVKAKALGNDIHLPATSASDAAQAMTELAKGGLSVTQSMQAARGTLQLAAAAQVSGAQAAEIQANALNAFGLKATSAGHVADVLANTANAASGEITDFAEGISQVGSVSKLFGINIDDMSTALGLFANNGIKGSDAGTTLKTMLTRLAAPSKAAQAAIQKLGLTVYDGQGKFEGLQALTGQLATAQQHMSDASFQAAAGVAFGTRAIRGAAILAQSGAGKFATLERSISKVGGAADLANAKMKGLPGAFQNAENALQNTALQIYDAVAPTVEKLVKEFTGAIPKISAVVVPVFKTVFGAIGKGVSVVSGLVGWVSKLPGPIKDIGVALAGLAIANKIGLIGKLSGAFNGVKTAVQGFRDEMVLQQKLSQTVPKEFDDFGNRLTIVGTAAETAQTKMSKFSTVVSVAKTRIGSALRSMGSSVVSAFGGPWGIAIAGATTAVGLFVDAWKKAHTPIVDVNQLVNENTGKLLANSKATLAAKLAQEGALTTAQNAGIAQGDVTDALLHGGKAYDDLIAKVKKYKEQQDAAAAASQGPIGSLLDLFSDNTAADHARQAAQLLQQLTNERNALTSAEKSGAQAGAEVDAAQKKSNASLTVTAKIHKSLQSAQDNYVQQLNAQYKSIGRTTGAQVDMSSAQANYLALLGQQHTAGVKQAADDKAEAAAAKAVALQAQATATNMQKLVAAQEAARQKAHDLTGAATQLELELARLSGRNVSAEEYARAFNGALSQMRDAAKNADGKVKMLSGSLIGAKGSIVTTTEAGQQLYDNVTGIAKVAQDYALKVAEATGKTKGQAAAEKAGAAALRTSRQAFIDNAKQMGLTAAEAKKLADRYFGLPKNIKTIIKGDFTDVTNRLNDLRNNPVVIPVIGQYSGTRGAPAHSTGLVAHAAGGWVSGPGSGTSDSIPARLSNGEFVVNARQAAKYGALLSAINSGAQGFAAGGYVAPTVGSLAGVQAPNLGPVASTVASALSTLRSAISATAGAVKTAAGKVKSAVKAYQQQVAEQGKTAKQQAANVASVRKEQAQRVADVKKANANRLANAQAALKDAKTASARASAQRAVTKARQTNETNLTKARRASTAAIGKAVAAQTKANAAEAKKTSAAKSAAKIADQGLVTAQRQAKMTATVIDRTKTLQTVQANLSKRLDTVTATLATARDNLASLKSSKADLASNIAGTVSGFGGGITGYAEQRNTPASILNGLQYNLKQVQGFQANLSKLASLGLNANDLSAIASAGVDSGGATAKALAMASKSQIAKINATEASIAKVSTKAGNLVASAVYDPAIKANQAQISNLTSQVKTLKDDLKQNATYMRDALTDALSGMRLDINAQGVAKLVAKGQAELARR